VKTKNYHVNLQTMQQAIKFIRSNLSASYSALELQSVSRLLISKVSGYSFTEIIVNKNTIFSEEQRKVLQNYVEKLKRGLPIQYVLGETEFFGLHFTVNDAVLIPRPETEELVQWMVEEIKHDSLILDIGTGSGCIAIALKHFLPDADVYACDIDEDSLEVATMNAENLGLKINFFPCDILKAEKSDRKYHVIVSNPPYIPCSERKDVMNRVKDFEPERALFVEDSDPLIFYRKIAQFAQSNLFPGGNLFFEVHRDFGKACVQLLEDMSYVKIQLKKDIFGNERMVRAVKK
jgi:release factor glutamine methyltransferase